MDPATFYYVVTSLGLAVSKGRTGRDGGSRECGKRREESARSGGGMAGGKKKRAGATARGDFCYSDFCPKTKRKTGALTR